MWGQPPCSAIWAQRGTGGEPSSSPALYMLAAVAVLRAASKNISVFPFFLVGLTSKRSSQALRPNGEYPMGKAAALLSVCGAGRWEALGAFTHVESWHAGCAWGRAQGSALRAVWFMLGSGVANSSPWWGALKFYVNSKIQASFWTFVLFVPSVVTMSGSCKLKKMGLSMGRASCLVSEGSRDCEHSAPNSRIPLSLWSRDPRCPVLGLRLPAGWKERMQHGMPRFLEEDQTHSNPRSASRRK